MMYASQFLILTVTAALLNTVLSSAVNLQAHDSIPEGIQLGAAHHSTGESHYETLNSGDTNTDNAVVKTSTEEPKPFMKPVWPTEFYATFAEDTWYQKGLQRENGWMLYSYTHATQVIYRTVSKFNPICDGVKPGDNTPCIHHSTDGASRFLIWPDTRECCLYCEEGCGTLNPHWVTTVPFHYAGVRNYNGVACDEWIIESSTPDRIATRQSDGGLCELYDGGAQFTGDNPFQITIDPNTYTTHFDKKLLQLPDYCLPAKKCPSDK